MKTLLRSLLLTVCLLTALPAQAQTRYYVDANATGNNNGSSWTHALKRLQNAFNNAGPGDEIWVAEGTYYPDEGASVTNNERAESFVLQTGVKIYGSFDGTETTLGERDVAAHPTILSGDIDKDGASSGNAYHVVRGGSAEASALLNGFIITAGNANGPNGSDQSGGGLFLVSSSPTLTNLTILDNKAKNDGGGLFINGGSPTLTHSTISDNRARRDGGGLYVLSGSPTLSGLTVAGNEAEDLAGGGGEGLGGGFCIAGGSPEITASTFEGNRARLGGGLFIRSSGLELVALTVTGNESTEGGAGLFAEAAVTVTGSTITGNEANTNGGGIFNQDSGTMVRSTILWDNSDGSGSGFAAQIHNDSATPTVSYSVVQGSGGSGAGWQASLGTDGGGNLDAEPLLGGLANNGGATLTRMPADTSPVIDTGSCFGQTEDQRGEMRPYDVGYSSFPNADDACDIGAVELQADEVSVPSCDGICYVDASATSGTGDGLSWDNAFTTLQSALAMATGRVQIWVAAGTYYPDEGTGQTNDDPTSSFELITGVAIYGGFAGGAGGETTLEERDVAANVAILSGDLDQDGTLAGNAYHVVTGVGVNTSAVMDGFTILSGNAAGATSGDNNGGGLYIGSGSPTLTGNTITNNTASDKGGGLLVGNGSPVLTGNKITNNTALLGGGLYMGSGNAMVANNTIGSNKAMLNGGGIIINSGNPTLMNNIINNNKTINREFGILDSGGGIYIASGSPTLMGNTIRGNKAMAGSGLYIVNGSPTLTNNTINKNNGDGIYVERGSPQITSNTITNNTGDGIYNQSGILLVRSTILWGNSGRQLANHAYYVTVMPVVSYSIIQGSGGSGAGWNEDLGTDGGGNLDANPLLGFLQDNGGPTLTHMPAFDSPAVDAGSCFSGTVTEDQRGKTRPVDNTSIPNADDGCDIGAVELFGDELLPVELTAFTALADGSRVLLHWETASETNNAGFEVQQWREAGSGMADAEWQTLVFIDGYGTTSEAKSYAHTIDDLAPGRHRFRLRQIDYDGTFDYSPEVEVAIGMDAAYLLTAPYPNPFNPQTQFSLMVKRAQAVRVSVYDMLGRRVAVLHEGELAAEQAQALVFEGSSLASGLYVIRAEGETFVAMQRVTLVK